MGSNREIKKHELELRRQQTSAMYLAQKTQAEIAAALGVSQTTVSKDLSLIRKRWQKSALVDMNEAKNRELARIDALEREYWLAWQASKEKQVTTTAKKKTTGGEEAIMTAREQTGDPRYLAGVQWCIERRSKILGIDAPELHNINVDVVKGYVGFDPDKAW